MEKKTLFEQHEEVKDSISFVHVRIHEALYVLEEQQK